MPVSVSMRPATDKTLFPPCILYHREIYILGDSHMGLYARVAYISIVVYRVIEMGLHSYPIYGYGLALLPQPNP